MLFRASLKPLALTTVWMSQKWWPLERGLPQGQQLIQKSTNLNRYLVSSLVLYWPNHHGYLFYKSRHP